MMTNTGVNGGTGFRIRRPRITTSGFVADVDPVVKSHLDELNRLLGKAVFTRQGPPSSDGGSSTPDEEYEKGSDESYSDLAAMPGKTKAKPLPPIQPPAAKGVAPAPPSDVRAMLARKLTPKHVPQNTWADGSLADTLSKTKSEPDKKITLEEHIDATPDLFKLKYAFKNHVEANEFTMDSNTKAVLIGYPAIADYLVAYGYYELGLRSPRALVDVLQSSPRGLRMIVNYGAISAARTRIFREKLDVPNYNRDDSKIVEDLQAANLPLSDVSFPKAADAIIDNYIFNSPEEALISAVEKEIGTIPASIRPQIVRNIKFSPIPIDATNAKFYISQFVMQNAGTLGQSDPFVEEQPPDDQTVDDSDFDVQYLEDDRSLIQISQSAVKCAAQLYYGMVLGDELDVFNAVNFFTHKYLVRGAFEIRNATLRNDLQRYVFDGEFSELDKNGKSTGRILKRTRPAERQMFYRQVFNQGHAPVTDDVVINGEFRKLWNVLMLESARYLEKAQMSPNPDSFVSRTNVMQAVEDLQYNLSTSCTGMSNVIAPLIYKELDFVVKRIFMHDEILAKVSPGGGTWSRVIETLYMDMKRSRPKATVLYNKAKLGHSIISSIASYNPATFEDDKNFSEFISNVDAYITTQSILQDSLTDDLKKEASDEDYEPTNGYGAQPPAANGNGNAHAYLPEASEAPAAAAAGQDDWDF
jgi:hypothetical protein